MELNAKIYVAGHRGLVGSAIVRALVAAGHTNIITRSRSELDLLNQSDVANFFATEKPEYVFLAAAKVGGIMANKTFPADFIYENLLVQTNVIHSAHQVKVEKLLFLGSSCIYPKLAPQPIKEEYFLTGPLEETNDAYAVAKIAGIKMCQAYNQQYGTNYISLMPTNLYGPGDNFNLETSHVLPGIIRRLHEAKENRTLSVTLWGTGSPMREFLHVDDLASSALYLMKHYNDTEIINVGTGVDITIRELAKTIQNIIGYTGEILWDISKPDGTPRKLLDVSKINNLGWKDSITLQKGIESTYQDFLRQI